MAEDNNIDNEGELDLEPKVGMIFNSEITAQNFYIMYAKKKGFGVVIVNSKKKEGIKFWIYFGCHKSGLPRTTADPASSQPTSKTDCKAAMKVSKQFDDNWKVNSVHLEHNHDMDPEKSRYLKCHRKLPAHVQRVIELNCETGIKMNKTINSFDRRAGDSQNRTWTEKDGRNLVDTIRRHNLKGGDAQAMMKYFQRMQAENKDFFYSIDIDEEKCLTKVFWADARSREAYKEFGDVVTFDTTYLVNRYNMPFAPFVGVNHHGHSTLFGCGLVTHEDEDSFVWLFKAWLACMSYIHPNAIITDQNRAMQNAIRRVLPNTRHRWCLWHIMKKVPEKFKAYTMYEKIQEAVNSVVYDSLTIHEFEDNWANLINFYELEENVWLRSMYEERNRWVPAFVKNTFWAGMSTTQRSESINAFFDNYVHSKTTLSEFAMQYENALRKKVEKEEHADHKSMNTQYPNMSPYPFELQFREAYTNSKFKQFRVQLNELIACQMEVGHVIDGIEHFIVEHTFEVGTTNKFMKTEKFVVQFNGSTGETNCICRMFESKGMVCAHMLQIWKWKKLTIVPERYILHRWRKNVGRAHTKVRLSYTNWQKKKEWRRFDDLMEMFNEAADMVIFSESKTENFKGILAEFIQENKQQCIQKMSSVLPKIINIQPHDQTLEGELMDIGDPSQGTKRGRPPELRKVSKHEKEAKKIANAIKKGQQSNASNKKAVPKKNTKSMKQAPEFQDSQKSVNLVDLNQPPIEWLDNGR